MRSSIEGAKFDEQNTEHYRTTFGDGSGFLRPTTSQDLNQSIGSDFSAGRDYFNDTSIVVNNEMFEQFNRQLSNPDNN